MYTQTDKISSTLACQQSQGRTKESQCSSEASLCLSTTFPFEAFRDKCVPSIFSPKPSPAGEEGKDDGGGDGKSDGGKDGGGGSKCKMSNPIRKCL